MSSHRIHSFTTQTQPRAAPEKYSDWIWVQVVSLLLRQNIIFYFIYSLQFLFLHPLEYFCFSSDYDAPIRDRPPLPLGSVLIVV